MKSYQAVYKILAKETDYISGETITDPNINLESHQAFRTRRH